MSQIKHGGYVLMNCQYCAQPCTKFSDKSVHYQCHPCRAAFYTEADGSINSIRLTHRVEERTYTVDLLLYCNRSIISYDEPYPAKYTYGGVEPDIHETMLAVDNILPITPQNFLDKLKFYMKFS